MGDGDLESHILASSCCTLIPPLYSLEYELLIHFESSSRKRTQHASRRETSFTPLEHTPHFTCMQPSLRIMNGCIAAWMSPSSFFNRPLLLAFRARAPILLHRLYAIDFGDLFFERSLPCHGALGKAVLILSSVKPQVVRAPILHLTSTTDPSLPPSVVRIWYPF